LTQAFDSCGSHKREPYPSCVQRTVLFIHLMAQSVACRRSGLALACSLGGLVLRASSFTLPPHAASAAGKVPSVTDDIFKVVDRDHSNGISADEFTSAIQSGILGSSLRNLDGSENFPSVEVRSHYHYAHSSTDSVKRITCIGDSITEGTCSSKGMSYPDQLQDLMGDGYNVSSYAADGRGLLASGFFPIWNEEELVAGAVASQPDVVVIAFGTNDGKVSGFDEEEYREMYDKMIKMFTALSPTPKVIMMTPPPVYDAGSEGHSAFLAPNVNEKLVPIIKDIALNHGLDLVDNFGSFASRCPDYDSTTCSVIAYEAGYKGDGETCKNDYVHPNDDGYAIIAKNVKAAIG